MFTFLRKFFEKKKVANATVVSPPCLKPKKDLLDRDYKEIEDILLGPHVWQEAQRKLCTDANMRRVLRRFNSSL